ncbi:hypothetical protein EC973_007013 [Apophysomyces ossiformis]|uniref:Tetraspanin n=1 Tax=Apophysomyces ossiformis TaxID=679940 RepID=A0A8H7BV54_9FUNG|nr:hypothetical protein EC973_007013 [Apophysomyces ossiformis]
MVIAICSSIFYICWLVGLLLRRYDILMFFQQDLSTATPVYWTCVAVIGLYSVSSLFGVVGSIAQNRKMIGIFKFMYWVMAIVLLCVSLAAWILMLVKRDSIVAGCNQYLQDISTSHSPYYTPVQLPNGAIFGKDDCEGAMKRVLIVGGVLVFIGNFLQIYFASAISAYADRLKRNNQHQKLRDLDDYPESKMAVY